MTMKDRMWMESGKLRKHKPNKPGAEKRRAQRISRLTKLLRRQELENEEEFE